MATATVQSATDELLEALISGRNKLEENSTVVRQIRDDQEAARKAAVTAEALSGTAGPDGTRKVLSALKVEQDAELLKQQQNNEYSSKLGINLAGNAKVATELAVDLNDSAIQSTRDAKIVRDKLGVRFLDSPIDWVMAQATVAGDVERANASRARVATAADALLKTNAAAQSQAVTNNNNKITLSGTVIADNLAAAQAAIDSRVQTHNFNLLGAGAGTVKLLMEADADRIKLLTTTQTAVINSGEWGIHQKQLALQTKNIESEIELRRLNIDATKMNAEGGKQIAETMVKGAWETEHIKLDPAMFTTAKLMHMFSAKDDKAVRWFNAGVNYEANGFPVVGATVADAIGNVMEFRGPGQPAAKTIIELLKSKVQVVSTVSPEKLPTLGLTGLNQAKKDEVHRGAAKLALNAAAEMHLDVSTPGNIYAFPPMDTIMADEGKYFKAVQTTPFFQKVLAPQYAAGGLVETNPDLLFQRGIAAVKAGIITGNEFDAGFSTLAQSMQTYNNGTTYYQGYGLTPQAGVNTRLTTGVLGGKESYNIAKQVDVTKARLKAALVQLNPGRYLQAPIDYTGEVLENYGLSGGSKK